MELHLNTASTDTSTNDTSSDNVPDIPDVIEDSGETEISGALQVSIDDDCQYVPEVLEDAATEISNTLLVSTDCDEEEYSGVSDLEATVIPS